MPGMSARRWELLTPEVLGPAGAQDQQGKVPATDEVIEPNHSCLLPNRPILTNSLPERLIGRDDLVGTYIDGSKILISLKNHGNSSHETSCLYRFGSTWGPSL